MDFQAIYIMWLREMKRFIRSRSRMIGALGQPLIFLISFGFGFGAVFRAAGEGNYIQFLAPGIIGMSIIFTSIFNGMQVIWDRQFGFLKETMVAPVPRSSIMLGRMLGAATVGTIQGTIVLCITFFIGFHPTNWTLVAPTILVMLLIGMLFAALGITVASLVKDMQGFQLIMNFLVQPLFYLSGALFPLNGLPAILSFVANIDPLSYGIDAMRALLINTTHYGLLPDISVMLGVTGLFVLLGSYFFSKIQI